MGLRLQWPTLKLVRGLFFGNILTPFDFSWHRGAVGSLVVWRALCKSHQIRADCSGGELMACRAPKPLSGRSFDVQRRGHTALFVGLCGPEMADRRRFGRFQLCIHHRHPFGRHHPRQRLGFRGARLGPTGLLGQYHRGLDVVGGRWCTRRGCGHVALKWPDYLKQGGLVDRAHFV